MEVSTKPGAIQSLNLKEFLEGLCEQFSSSVATNVLTCDATPVMIPTDHAVPLGLLVNELITNAVKYASPEKPGDVSISIKSCGDGLRLEVRDHGPGLSADWQQKQSASLGMKLISRLSRQLGGEPQWLNALPGLRFILEFPA